MKQLLVTAKNKLKHSLSDGLHARIMYLLVRHEVLHLKHPRGYSEKIQWLKTYGNLEQYASLSDKYEVREYVEAKVDKKHLIPLIGVWDSFDDVPFDTLPNKFVMKASHGCGYNIVVTDKKSVDVADMRKQMTQWLQENYYDVSREAQYKFCKPRIVVEKYIEGDNGDLKDFKFYCFDGKPELIMVANDRSTGTTLDIFDMSWKKLPCLIGSYPNSAKPALKPAQFDQMVEMAAKLSHDLPLVRVDLYCSGNTVYFGELTFTSSSGLEKFGSKEFERWLGKKVDLSAYTSTSAGQEVETLQLA